MRHEEQLRERITMALQSRHATDSVRVTTNDKTLTMGTGAAGMSTALRTYLFLERAMVEIDGINPKVADDLRDRMDAIWHALTESERARLDDRTECSWSACAETGLGHERTTVSWHESELDALTSLAIALGLDADGSDPRAEVERLRAEQLAADDRIEDACDARDNALDDRDGLIAEIKCLRANAPVAANRLVATCIANSLADAEAVRLSARAENARLTRERDAALDALYEYAPRCRNCGCISTRVGGDYIALCDSDACARGVPDVRDVTHSDALRSANPLDDHARPSPPADVSRERDAARAEVARLRARIDAAAVVAADLIHEERCDWSGEPGREADCNCGVNTLRALLASAEA